MEELEVKRPLGSPRSRRDSINEIDLREVGFGFLGWIHLA
jgi:hypothetical protein